MLPPRACNRTTSHGPNPRDVGLNPVFIHALCCSLRGRGMRAAGCFHTGGWRRSGRSSARTTRLDLAVSHEADERQLGPRVEGASEPPPTAPGPPTVARESTVPATATSETRWVFSCASPRAHNTPRWPQTGSQKLIVPFLLGWSPRRVAPIAPQDPEMTISRRDRRFSRCGLMCHHSLNPFLPPEPSNSKARGISFSDALTTTGPSPHAAHTPPIRPESAK